MGLPLLLHTESAPTQGEGGLQKETVWYQSCAALSVLSGTIYNTALMWLQLPVVAAVAL